MKKENIRQFKMVSGDEVICEVVDWEPDDDFSIVVKNLYKVHLVEDHDQNIRYYSLRPYLCFQTGDDLFQTINEAHVMASALPTETMVAQYKTTLKLERVTKMEIEKELDERISSLKAMLDDDTDMDTDDDHENVDNILKFTPKDKLH